MKHSDFLELQSQVESLQQMSELFARQVAMLGTRLEAIGETDGATAQTVLGIGADDR
jgi:hypothetical protein